MKLLCITDGNIKLYNQIGKHFGGIFKNKSVYLLYEPAIQI